MTKGLTVDVIHYNYRETFTAVQELTFPTLAGPVTVFPGHATLITGLAPGNLKISPQGKTYDVHAGVFKVQGDHCHILLSPIKSESSLDKLDLTAYPDLSLAFDLAYQKLTLKS